MAQITSREELRSWLRDKPIDWVEAVTVRASLRTLPYALIEWVSESWLKHYALTLMRRLAVPWIIANLQATGSLKFEKILGSTNIAYPADFAGSRSDAAGMRTVRSAINAIEIGFLASARPTANSAGEIAQNLSYAAGYAGAYLSSSVDFVQSDDDDFHVGTAFNEWKNIDEDCRFLAFHRGQDLASFSLLKTPIFWSYRVQSFSSDRSPVLDKLLSTAATRFLTLDPTYQVWIDRYNRRIEGHDAAFDIPGDTDRTHDKAILARLADATDADFWGKGATYVNTTLQGWIDEARIDARIDAVAAKLHGGATARYGAPEEMVGRAALLQELDPLLGRPPQARLGIGGNNPPEPIDLSVRPVALPDEMREPLEAISTELEKREPDALVVVEKVKLLHRVVRKLEKMADIASDEFAKSVGGELGKLVVKGVFWLAVINQILDWLTPLIRISG